MKVYISADMEGTSGICSPDFCTRGNPLYEQGRRLLVGDVNAAIEGALEGGATDILLADVHGGSFHLPLEQIHPRARVLYGVPQSGPRFPGLDSSVDLVFLLAYHAKAGTLHATLEHTMSSRSWFRLEVNGREIGEVGIDAALAGAVGVPVVLVTGDDKVCAEARGLLGEIETAQVKTGLGRTRALCLSLDESRQHIRQAARRAMALKGRVAPLDLGSPVEIALTYKNTDQADAAALVVGRDERRDGYTIVRRFERFADWYGGVWSGEYL